MDARERLTTGLRDVLWGSVLLLIGGVPIAVVLGVAVGLAWRVAIYIIHF